ncbi:MAG: hypothetical protein AAGH15_06480 [Myxococcota bacterium]
MTSRSLAAALLALVLPAACVGYAPGLEVDVAYQPEPMTAAFFTDQGHRVRLEAAVLRIESLELVPCEDGALASLLRALGPGRARAHGTLELGTGEAFTLDVMHAGGLPVRAGTLRPLPGRYCGARLHLEAGEAPTLALRGRIEREGRTEPFAVEIAFQRDLPLALDVPLMLDDAALGAGAGRVGLRVRFDAARWFDGAGQRNGDRFEEAVVTNVLGSFTLETGAGPNGFEGRADAPEDDS